MGIARRDLIIGGAVVGGAVGLYFAAKAIHRCIRNYRHPLIPVGIVSELYVYPINSCRGRQVQTMECEMFGGVRDGLKDRHFAVINSDTKQILSCQTHPRMALIDCDVTDGILTMTTAEHTTIKLHLDKIIENNKLIKTTFCGQSGFDCGNVASEWLSGVLQVDEPVGLLYFQDGLITERLCCCHVKAAVSSDPARDKEQLPYMNSAPYLALSAETINELNVQFELQSSKRITARHYRPSVVVTGYSAFAEGSWLELKIGDVVFDCCSVTSRCPIIAVDPSTGDRDIELEPTNISEHSKPENEIEIEVPRKGIPEFGVYMGLKKKGTIKVGDHVFARYRHHIQ